MSSALHEQMEAAVADLRAQRDRIRESSRRLSEASHAATSPDRSVEVTVDAQGRLTGLSLKGTAYRTLAPTEFADRIAKTVLAAQDAAAARSAATLAEYAPARLRQVLAGTFDLDAMFDAAIEAGEGPIFAGERPGTRP
jgi:hypothetical protein